MNNLSWFIYLTQVVDNLSGAAVAILFFVGIFGGLGLLAFYVVTVVEFEGDTEDKRELYLLSMRGRLSTVFVVAMVSASLIAIFMPSRRTMIMIAGSEIGERVAKSEEVNSIVNPGLDLIRKWIKQEADKIKDKS